MMNCARPRRETSRNFTRLTFLLDLNRVKLTVMGVDVVPDHFFALLSSFFLGEGEVYTVDYKVNTP